MFPARSPHPPSARGTLITAAGILLVVVGAFRVALTGTTGTLGVLVVAEGFLEVYAGVLVLRRREMGWVIGLVFMAVFAVFSLMAALSGQMLALVPLAISLFVVVTLAANRREFA